MEPKDSNRSQGLATDRPGVWLVKGRGMRIDDQGWVGRKRVRMGRAAFRARTRKGSRPPVRKSGYRVPTRTCAGRRGRKKYRASPYRVLGCPYRGANCLPPSPNPFSHSNQLPTVRSTHLQVCYVLFFFLFLFLLNRRMIRGF